MVAAGDQSDALGTVLERLADDLEARQALRAKVLGAMLYPAIVSVVALVIVLVLVTYVVPQIANVFTSSKRALQTAAETLGNRATRADALEALVQAREGAPLASVLAAKKRFPVLLIPHVPVHPWGLALTIPLRLLLA